MFLAVKLSKKSKVGYPIKFLLKVVEGDPNVRLQLLNRLRELFKSPENASSVNIHRRTFSELVEISQQQAQRRHEQELLVAQQIKKRKLEALALKEESVWLEVYRLIEIKQAKQYEQAVGYLVDLRDLAEYQDKLDEFKACIQKIQKDYSSRSGLLSRLKKAGLFKL